MTEFQLVTHLRSDDMFCYIGLLQKKDLEKLNSLKFTLRPSEIQKFSAVFYNNIFLNSPKKCLKFLSLSTKA